MGLSGGFVPSASAILLWLGAISLGRAGMGLVLVAIFGVGMATALVGVGLAVVAARDLGERRMAGRFGAVVRRVAAPAAAGAVVVLGLVLTARAVGDLIA